MIIEIWFEYTCLYSYRSVPAGWTGRVGRRKGRLTTLLVAQVGL